MDNMVFLVAVPKGALYYCCEKIQQLIWTKYDLGNHTLPEIHLTIDAFYYKNKKELENIKSTLFEILSKIEPFEIRANGFGYIPDPHNCLTLHIVKTKELKDVYTLIHTSMENKGFQVRAFSPEEIVFHISLAGTHGRTWSQEESLDAWNEIKEFKLREISFIDEFELWYPELDPNVKRIGKIKLRGIK
ncbi:2'-5' RNA ligase family protein [Clostridiaceae bacterium 35-E11]